MIGKDYSKNALRRFAQKIPTLPGLFLYQRILALTLWILCMLMMQRVFLKWYLRQLEPLPLSRVERRFLARDVKPYEPKRMVFEFRL